MSGKCRGVQSYVQNQYPKAVNVHCAAHSPNLAVSTASDIQQIRNCLGVIEKMYTFFNTAKRSVVIYNVIEQENADLKVKKLKRLCATRWIQRYDSVNDSLNYYHMLCFLWTKYRNGKIRLMRPC